MRLPPLHLDAAGGERRPACPGCWSAAAPRPMPSCSQHGGGDQEVALIGAPAERAVGIQRVEPADPAAYRRAACSPGRCRGLPAPGRAARPAPSAAMRLDGAAQLRPAIAAQRAQQVAGEAFGMDARQRRAPAGQRAASGRPTRMARCSMPPSAARKATMPGLRRVLQRHRGLGHPAQAGRGGGGIGEHVGRLDREQVGRSRPGASRAGAATSAGSSRPSLASARARRSQRRRRRRRSGCVPGSRRSAVGSARLRSTAGSSRAGGRRSATAPRLGAHGRPARGAAKRRRRAQPRRAPAPAAAPAGCGRARRARESPRAEPSPPRRPPSACRRRAAAPACRGADRERRGARRAEPRSDAVTAPAVDCNRFCADRVLEGSCSRADGPRPRMAHGECGSETAPRQEGRTQIVPLCDAARSDCGAASSCWRPFRSTP